jgi:hypothetical protein
VGERQMHFAPFALSSETPTCLPILSMMAPRLLELRRVLTVTGSLYLHCDPPA